MRSENHFVREREILRTTYGLKIAGPDTTRYAHVGLESARADDTAVKSCIPGSGGSADGLSGFQEHEFGTKTPTAHNVRSERSENGDGQRVDRRPGTNGLRGR